MDYPEWDGRIRLQASVGALSALYRAAAACMQLFLHCFMLVLHSMLPCCKERTAVLEHGLAHSAAVCYLTFLPW